MNAVIEANKVCEGTICYTGDLLDPARSKYDLKYYLDCAKELKSAGAHVLGLKDMAGLLKPAAARILVDPAVHDGFGWIRRAPREGLSVAGHGHRSDAEPLRVGDDVRSARACDAGTDA